MKKGKENELLLKRLKRKIENMKNKKKEGKEII